MVRFFLNRALRILLITNFLIMLSSAMMGPIYALFVLNVGGDLLDASLTAAILALAAGITSFLSGRYADKVKENELIIVFGYAMVALGYFMYLFVNSIWFLFLIQIIIGFGEAIYAPAFDAVYSKHLNNHRVGVQWGAWETLNYFTFAFGAVIGGLLVQNFGFNVIFLIMMVLCSGSALYIYLLPRRVL